MELREAVRRRNSTAAITQEAPTDERLHELVGLAAHAPDHAGLRPWRLVTVRGAERERLGEAMAAGFGDPAGSAEALKTAAKTTRAPLLVGIVLQPVEHRKVPRWEQVAATAAMVATLELLLFDDGWTAMWRTGPGAELPEVIKVMGVAEAEQLLGWLYVGATSGDTGAGASRDPDVGDRISGLPG